MIVTCRVKARHVLSSRFAARQAVTDARARHPTQFTSAPVADPDTLGLT